MREVKVKRRTWVQALACLAMGGMLCAWTLWPSPDAVALKFTGFSLCGKTRPGGRPITYAEFELVNQTRKTIYYEGTPYPVYYVEYKENGKWVPHEEVTEPETFSALFPHRRFKFRMIAPNAPNKWRVTVHWIRPRAAPVTLRRFFPPRPGLLASQELGAPPVIIATSEVKLAVSHPPSGAR